MDAKSQLRLSTGRGKNFILKARKITAQPGYITWLVANEYSEEPWPYCLRELFFARSLNMSTLIFLTQGLMDRLRSYVPMQIGSNTYVDQQWVWRRAALAEKKPRKVFENLPHVEFS
ncbi:hypothetical protein HK102_002641 [Quaeritorhiza haematococci]|nr:hypothetical protein HK102_002641 [Quaeritorhiza haematococci]